MKRLTLTAHERGVLRSAQATSERNRKRPITLRNFEQTLSRGTVVTDGAPGVHTARSASGAGSIPASPLHDDRGART